MATSPTPGIPSSSSVLEQKEAARVLSAISKSDILAKIQASLGPTAALHLAGGTVRDALLGISGSDYDLTCALSAQHCAAALELSGIKIVETGLKHGTITAVVDGYNIEITTFRAGRGPVSGTLTIEDDLAGRDFTINAMAFSLDSLTLIDPFNGTADLRAAQLKAVGNAEERFLEDPLRILRMVRFGPAQGRAVDADTRAAAEKHRDKLENVSPERIRVELERILLGEYAADGIRALHTCGLLPFTVPEIQKTIGFEQNDFHIHDVFEHTLWVIERSPLDLHVRLAALFHDLGKPDSLSVGEDGRRHFFKHELISDGICKQRMRALRFSNDDIEAVRTIVRLHMRPLNCGPAGIRRLMRDLGPHFAPWRALKLADAPPRVSEREVLEQLHQFDRAVEAEKERAAKSGGLGLAISGDDLIALGMRPGKALGQVLKTLEEQVIENPEINQRERLLAEAQRLLSI